MSAKKAFAGLLKGILAKYLKAALVYLKNPKKLSRLLTAVLVYAMENKGAVKTFLKDILLLWEMLNAWFKGEYKDIPKKTIVLIITALIYFISPIDLIPDWLPGGFIDDAALITWVLQSMSLDIHKFKIWKKKGKKVSLSFV
ncbi:MAG: DUF1232 domain-containing protein [Bacteroidota bacterium]